MAKLIETVIEYEFKPPCKTAEEMEKICCEPAEKLTCCEKIDSGWYGSTEQEILKKYHPDLDDKGRDPQGRYVVIELLHRQKICGEKLIIYDTSGGNCCDEITAIEIDDDATPDILPAGGMVAIFITGGEPPYTYKTSANNTFFINDKKSITTEEDSVRLYANDDFCGATEVSVSDSCSNDSVLIRSDTGSWELISNDCVVSGIEMDDPGGLYGSFWEAAKGMYKIVEMVGYDATFVGLGGACNRAQHCMILPDVCIDGLAASGNPGDTCLEIPESKTDECDTCDDILSNELKCGPSSIAIMVGGGYDYRAFTSGQIWAYQWVC